MKTAISIPDSLFQSAEQLANRLGVSRSELYARAVGHFVEQHRDDLITQRLNALYGESGLSSVLDPAVQALQYRSLPPGEE